MEHLVSWRLRKTSLSKQRGGGTPSQRVEHRRLCGLVVPGRDVGSGLPGFSYQPGLWLKGSRAKFLGFWQRDCKTQERKPQVSAQGLWGKSTFWKWKKKKKITQLSYNLGPFPIRREHFFPAYCLTRLSPGSSVKPSQAPRVFSVGWIEEPGGPSKRSQPGCVVTRGAHGAGPWRQRGSAWILLFASPFCFPQSRALWDAGRREPFPQTLRVSLPRVSAAVCSAVSSGPSLRRPTRMPKPQPEPRPRANVLYVPPALKLCFLCRDRVGGCLQGWVGRTTWARLPSQASHLLSPDQRRFLIFRNHLRKWKPYL